LPVFKEITARVISLRETLNKPFDKLRANGNWLIPFVVSLSNHEWNQLVQYFLRRAGSRRWTKVDTADFLGFHAGC
jgi:hypothetical protein